MADNKDDFYYKNLSRTCERLALKVIFTSPIKTCCERWRDTQNIKKKYKSLFLHRKIGRIMFCFNTAIK